MARLVSREEAVQEQARVLPEPDLADHAYHGVALEDVDVAGPHAFILGRHHLDIIAIAGAGLEGLGEAQALPAGGDVEVVGRVGRVAAVHDEACQVGDAVYPVRGRVPDAALVLGERDVGAGLVVVHDYGAHAAVPLCVVDELAEERVGHVPRQPVGLAGRCSRPERLDPA